MTSIEMTKLPQNIQGPAFDAAVASANEYAIRNGHEQPQLEVTPATVAQADAYIQRTGSLVTGRNTSMAIDKAAFSQNMMTLAAYMKQNAIESISVSKDNLDGVPGSVIAGAFNALFERGF